MKDDYEARRRDGDGDYAVVLPQVDEFEEVIVP
jgi:hypothetical protein